MRKQVVSFILFSIFYSLFSGVLADTIYFNNGTTDKGLVVEEYYDRFVFSTPDGEKEVLTAAVDEIFFDEPYLNNLYLGKRSEAAGDFDKALVFYQLAFQANPDYIQTQDAIKGFEDAKWRYKKSWTYREMKETLKTQLGISLRKVNENIIISKIDDGLIHSRRGGLNLPYGDLSQGDIIIRSWAQPLTYAGLKNASRSLVGLSNTILNVVIEREISVPPIQKFKLFSLLNIEMGLEGPVAKPSGTDNPFYKAGLREGDLITAINGESTRYMTTPELKRKLLKAKAKELTVRRKVILMRKRPERKETYAMWVWHSKEVLLNEAKKKELLDFCKGKDIGLLFFQLQYQFLPMGSRHLNVGYQAETVCKLLYESKLKAFLKEAHAQSVAVYALDGAPEFCLESAHHLVLAQIKAILDYNKAASPQERFDGVHYDNEPYLLPGFSSASKEAIISQFVGLNNKCRDFIKASGAKLEFGIDIPFWFDELNRLDKTLIDICDNIGIMDYRNFADGPDGIVELALNELKYASETNKKVFIGIETSKYPPQEVYFVSALGEEEFNQKPLGETRIDGFPLRVYTHDKKFYIGLSKPQGADEERFQKALSRVGELFGRVAKPADAEEAKKFIFNIVYALSSNPEYIDPQPREYQDKDSRTFLIFAAKEEMLEKLTFADKTEGDLNTVLAAARKGFEVYPSFAGFAIHHYKSYRELCEKK